MSKRVPTVILLYFIQCALCHLKIPVAQTKGNDATCLQGFPITPCRTLKYVLQYVLASNETSVDIDFIEDYQFSKLQPLQILTEDDKPLNLRMYAKLSTNPASVSKIKLTCSDGAHGIFYVHGAKLSLEYHNITFSNCGRGNEEAIMPLIVANETKRVSFHFCIFQDNECGAFYAVNTNINIENSIFRRNSIAKISNTSTFNSNNMNSFSAGVGALFQHERRAMSVNVFQTIFVQNHVHVDYSKHFVDRTPENVVSRGGAMRVTFINKSTYWTKINITLCHFESNEATFGGALLIELFGTAAKNKITISSSTFIANKGSQEGGGFLFAMRDYSAKTILTMTDCILQENFSKSGSAVCVSLQSRHSLRHEKKEVLLFRRLQIARNVGIVASGVRIGSPIFGPRPLDQITVFEDCLFINNSSPIGFALLGSLVVDRVNLIFNGTNQFIRNVFFGAVYFSNSKIHVFGKLQFRANVGLVGGAVLMKNSQIVVHPGSDILFQDNFARLNGGAVSVSTDAADDIPAVNNLFCFLVHSETVNPSEWNVSVFAYSSMIINKACYLHIYTAEACPKIEI